MGIVWGVNPTEIFPLTGDEQKIKGLLGNQFTPPPPPPTTISMGGPMTKNDFVYHCLVLTIPLMTNFHFTEVDTLMMSERCENSTYSSHAVKISSVRINIQLKSLVLNVLC